jgi:hypothetical protein
MMMAIAGIFIGVCCGILIATSAYALGRIHEKENMREVYNEAADFATNQQCDG